MDNEGYPRSDVDVWGIAEIRKKVVPLQNDHIAIMKQIEKLLLVAFASNNNNSNNDEEKNYDNKN